MRTLRTILTKFDLFTWYLNFIDAFIPRKIKDKKIEDLNRARFLVGPPILTGVLGIIYILFYIYSGDYFSALVVFFPIISLPLYLGIFRLTGAITVISNIMIISFIVPFFLMSFSMGGLITPPLLWYVLIPIMATGTLGRKPAYFWTMVCCSIIIFLFVVEGHINVYNKYDENLYKSLYLLCVLGLLVLVFCFAVLYEAFKDYAINRLFESESTFRKVNEDLENEIFKRSQLQNLAHELNVLKENLLAPATLSNRLNLITDSIIKSFDAAFTGIWVLKEGDKCEKCLHMNGAEPNKRCKDEEPCLHLIAYSGIFTPVKNEEFRRVPKGKYKIGKITLSDRSKFLTNNIYRDAWEGCHKWAQSMNITAFACYKLLSSDQSGIGILAVLNRKSFSVYEDTQLEGIANAASNVIQLEIAEETLRKTRKQLIESEKMSALGNLVAGVAHEISTPIGIGVTASSYIEDYLETVGEKITSGELNPSEIKMCMEKIIESSSMIQNNLKRASELITSFKQVAVDQSNEIKRKFAVREFFDGLLTSLHYLHKRTNHEIKIICPDHMEIYSYPGTFSQIITNFIMNSIAHGFSGSEKGEINIGIYPIDDVLKLHYSDNGRGMDEKTVGQIFDPFFTTNRDKGGTGLGMTIVYNLVTQKLKGDISCISSPGKGTEFSIRIPLNDEEIHLQN